MDINAWRDPAQVREVAIKTLDLEPDDPVPPFYLPILSAYMRHHSFDTNFILELAEKGRAGIGGNGFGTVTCMEDSCWKVRSPAVSSSEVEVKGWWHADEQDVILDAHPTRKNGGKDEGLGSLYNYQVHCREDDHIKGRNDRLRLLVRRFSHLPSWTPTAWHHTSTGLTSAVCPSAVPSSRWHSRS
jgi:hypothetical protein